jgi:hypothetical protein
MKNRYVVFSGKLYYPEGGWKDLHSVWNTEAEAIAAASVLHDPEVKCTWAMAVDLETRNILPLVNCKQIENHDDGVWAR